MKSISKATRSLVIMIVVLSQFINPISARADGETPPPASETPSTEAAPMNLNPNKPGVDGIRTEPPPVETATPSPESPDKPAILTDTPPDPVEPAPSEVLLSPRARALGDVLRDLPEPTTVFVLDDIGKPLPLASQEAAQVITQGDPVWCPDGQAPTPGANGCTISYLTLADLVANEGASIAANGTIWITSGPVADLSPILIDGSLYTNWATYELALQGGWDGISGSTTVLSSSVFTAPISISAWVGNVTIDNITIQNTNSTGLSVETAGTITAHDITANNNSWDGASLNGGSGVTLTGANAFSNNANNGLFVYSDGHITLNQITANGNGQGGVSVGGSYGNLSLNQVTANGNRFGASLFNEWGPIVITGTNEFSNNLEGGLWARSETGDITLNQIAANGNGGTGVFLHTGNGHVTMTGSNTFNDNLGWGFVANSGRDILLNQITANGNGESGVSLSSYVGGITLTGTNEFNNNRVSGFQATSLVGTITLNNVAATGNDTDVSLFTPVNTTVNGAIVGSLDATAVCGILSLNGVSASTILYPVSGEHTYIDGLFGDEYTIYCEPQVYVDGSLLGEVPVAPAQYEFDLSCKSQTLYPVNLPNGDRITIVCPVSGRALISRLDNTTIPSDLPAGYTYASAFSVDILQAGEPIPVITEGGHIEVSFQVPSQQEATYSILFWDNGTWVPLNEFIGPKTDPQHFDLNPGVTTDLRELLSGVKIETRNGVQRVEVSTNFPGIFVLAGQ